MIGVDGFAVSLMALSLGVVGTLILSLMANEMLQFFTSLLLGMGMLVTVISLGWGCIYVLQIFYHLMAPYVG